MRTKGKAGVDTYRDTNIPLSLYAAIEEKINFRRAANNAQAVAAKAAGKQIGGKAYNGDKGRY